MEKEVLIYQLKELRPQALDSYKADLKGIFGSWARNEQTTSSDLDVLVYFQPGATLLDLSGLRIFLEEKLHIPIELVSENAINKDIRPYIYRDLVRI
jgi:predicted nucleotidyltransferase